MNIPFIYLQNNSSKKLRLNIKLLNQYYYYLKHTLTSRINGILKSGFDGALKMNINVQTEFD